MALFPTGDRSTSLVSQLQPRTNSPTENDSAILPASVSTGRMTHIINDNTAVLSAAFVDGIPIKGTYYRKLASQNHNRSTPVGSDRHDTSVYSSYIMIKDMEMRSLGAFTHDYNTERGTFSYTVEAVTYPGVIPLIGDIFLLPMEDVTAVFRVTNTTPMTWRNNSMTKVSMSWTETYSPELHQTLNNSVVTKLEFDLKTMLEYRSYLTEESVTNIYKLRALKKSLAIYMRRHFYYSDMNTYIRSDGVYDPYVVRYMQMTQDNTLFEHYTPNQINPLLTTTQFEASLFGGMVRLCNFSYLLKMSRREWFMPSSRSSILTALTNREYVLLGSSELYTDSYVFPAEFYEGIAQTELETVVMDYLINETSPASDIILKLGNELPTWTDANLRFYAVPLLIHLSSLSEIRLKQTGDQQL